ncbi:MAG: nucleoside-diphosphate kinase [Anaerolineales bacterium]
MEKTFVLIKPDGVQRGLVGEIIARLERRGLRLIGAKFMKVSIELAETHYAIHKSKPFYNSLINYITSSPVMAMVWEGKNAVAAVRQTMGSTNPIDAAPGSIRHDFGLDIGRNITHASDSVENGEKETALWFGPSEIVAWQQNSEEWIYE